MVKKNLLKEYLDREFDKEYEKRFGEPRVLVFNNIDEYKKYTKELKNFAKEFDNKHLKNPEYQKQIKKTIKKLNESKGDKNMNYMYYTPSGINAITVEFEFKNKLTQKDVLFDYEVPHEIFIGAVKEYFKNHFDVVLDGDYVDIWNMLADLGEMVDKDLIQEFIDNKDIQENLKEKVKEEAEEKFDELCQEEADDEAIEDKEDDYLDESYENDEELEDEGDYYDDEDEDYNLPEIEVFYRVYFTDKDGDELYSVNDGKYDFDSSYKTREEALKAMKKILKNPKVQADSEISGCHSVFLPADEDDWDEYSEEYYDIYGYDPFEVVDEVKKK